MNAVLLIPEIAIWLSVAGVALGMLVWVMAQDHAIGMVMRDGGWVHTFSPMKRRWYWIKGGKWPEMKPPPPPPRGGSGGMQPPPQEPRAASEAGGRA